MFFPQKLPNRILYTVLVGRFLPSSQYICWWYIATCINIRWNGFWVKIVWSYDIRSSGFWWNDVRRSGFDCNVLRSSCMGPILTKVVLFYTTLSSYLVFRRSVSLTFESCLSKYNISISTAFGRHSCGRVQTLSKFTSLVLSGA
jgi:hypothetical protein